MYREFLQRKKESEKASEAQKKQLELDAERVAKFKANQTILGASIVNFGSPAEKVSKLIRTESHFLT